MTEQDKIGCVDKISATPKRLLVGSADAGPANYLAYLNKIPFFDVSYVGTTSGSLIFNDLGLTVREMKDVNFNIDLVVTGTCVSDGIDKDLLWTARAMDIPSVSIVEAWTYFQERFRSGGRLLLPDYIFLNDDTAFTLALEAGLPQERLRIVGNPVLEDRLSNFADSEVRIDASIRNCDSDAVCFVSESLAKDSNIEGFERTFFDEYDVFRDLVSVLEPTKKVFIKLHPDDLPGKFDSLSNGRSLSYFDRLHPRSLSEFPGRIVGMESMYLLELACYRKDVISYRPNADDNWIGQQMGVVLTAKTRDQLHRALTKNAVAGKSMPNFAGSLEKLGQQLIELCS